MVAHLREQRVAAAGDQAQERRLEPLGLEEGRGHVTLEVVHRRERQAPGRREALGRLQPDEQRADQPRAAGDGYQVDVIQRRARAIQRVVDNAVDQL